MTIVDLMTFLSLCATFFGLGYAIGSSNKTKK